ncbi:GGDEF domain-containing protein, partial [bacterium]|nr:GGDEF domain-containing protein [bacterium]
RSLDQRLKEEFARAQRYSREFSVIMMDIDHFKMVNDKYGHHTGDVVLKRVADLIAQTVRGADIPHRYGGEEFVILATETGIVGAKKCAERICLLCQEGHFGEKEDPISIRISGGISSFPLRSVSDSAELLREADTALYKAKAAGGNSISLIEE